MSWKKSNAVSLFRGLSLLALLLAGCAVQEATSTMAPVAPTSTVPPAPTIEPKTIAVCLYADIVGLDVRAQTVYNVRSIQGNIQDYLIEHRGLDLTPSLAVSWEYLDPTTLRLYLREGVEFHNGEAFNAEATKYSLELQKNSDAGIRGYLDNLKEVQIVDEYTVDLILENPNPAMANMMTALYMYPPEYTEEAGDGFFEAPIGTGPFKFVDWVKGDYVTVEANEDYWNAGELWGGPPPVDTVVFRICPEISTRVAMLERGEVDLITGVLPEMVEPLRENPGTKTISEPGPQKMYLDMDARPGSSPPIDDVRVRQAINYAIDRDSIIEYVLLGYARKLGGYLHYNLPGASPDLEPWPYDPEKAKELLEEAGYPDGFELDLFHTVNAFLKDKEIAEALAQQLAQVGVRAKLVPMEFADFSDKFVQGEMTDIWLHRSGITTGDPREDYSWYLWSEGVANYVPDEELDALYEESEQILDPEERIRFFEQTLEPYVTNELTPIANLLQIEDIFGLSNRLDWYPVNPKEPIDLRGVISVQD